MRSLKDFGRLPGERWDLDQALLHKLAARGAEGRVREIEREIAEHELAIENLRRERAAIAGEFKIKLSRDDDDGEPADPNLLTRDQLRAEIQRVLAGNGRVEMDSDSIARAIEAHNPGKRVAMTRSAANRVAMMCAKMASVRKREKGWVWN